MPGETDESPNETYIASPEASFRVEEVDALDAGTIKDPSVPESRNRWIEKHQEHTRALLSIVFSISYLAMVIIVLWYFLSTHQPNWLDKESLQDISSFILSPVATLVGTIMGFYFGSKSSEK